MGTFEEKARDASEGILIFHNLVVLCALGRHQGKISIGTLDEKGLGASEGTHIFYFVLCCLLLFVTRGRSTLAH